jgi:acetyltransferase-like isoleucine patch superfamily enzyme
MGSNIHIRSGTVIYAGCEIGDNVHIGHNVVLREFTKIGDNSSIGSDVVCEGYTVIGNHTTVHAQTHLTALMFIGDYVFIGPKVTTANDRFPRYYRPNLAGDLEGPFISSEAIICAGAILLPKVKIGQGAIVGAGSVVTKDVEKYTMVFGNPAKFYRNVQDHEKVNRNPEPKGSTWR